MTGRARSDLAQVLHELRRCAISSTIVGLLVKVVSVRSRAKSILLPSMNGILDRPMIQKAAGCDLGSNRYSRLPYGNATSVYSFVRLQALQNTSKHEDSTTYMHYQKHCHNSGATCTRARNRNAIITSSSRHNHLDKLETPAPHYITLLPFLLHRPLALNY